MNRQGWLERSQTDLYFTLARIVPGTNVLAFVASTAAAVRGWAGALTALAALSVPASVAVVLLTLLYQRWHTHAVGGAFISAAMSAIVGIVLSAGLLLALPRFVRGARVRTLALVFGAAALSVWLSPLVILLLLAAVGYLWPDRE